MAMSNDDNYGFIGAALCLGVAWYDEAWRPFWLTVGFLLLVWSLISHFGSKK